MARKPYPSNLTHEQWSIIELMIPLAEPGGRRRSANMREVINGILYLNRTGCLWRQPLPRTPSTLSVIMRTVLHVCFQNHQPSKLPDMDNLRVAVAVWTNFTTTHTSCVDFNRHRVDVLGTDSEHDRDQ